MSKINVALIGAGSWGSNFAYVLSKLSQAELVAVADVKKELVDKLSRELKTKAYVDYHKMLDQELLDAVFVCTPDWAHLEPCLSTIKKGLHLFVEKPLTQNVEDGKKIIEAAKDKGIKLMVGHILRFDPRYYQAYKAVQEGRIGKIIHIFCRRNDMQTSAIRFAGKTNPAFFLAVHDLDFIRFLAGDVERVYSESTKVLFKNLPTVDGFSTVIKFKNGATALLENYWILPKSRGKSTARLEITGTEGVIFVDDYDRKLEIYDSKGVEYPDTIMKPIVWDIPVGVLKEEICSFIECIINDKKPLITGEDGLEAVKLAIAICESAEKGRVIEVKS